MLAKNGILVLFSTSGVNHYRLDLEFVPRKNVMIELPKRSVAFSRLR